MLIDVLHNDARAARPATLTVQCGRLTLQGGDIIAQLPDGRAVKCRTLEEAEREFDEFEQQHCEGK